MDHLRKKGNIKTTFHVLSLTYYSVVRVNGVKDETRLIVTCRSINGKRLSDSLPNNFSLLYKKRSY